VCQEFTFVESITAEDLGGGRFNLNDYLARRCRPALSSGWKVKEGAAFSRTGSTGRGPGGYSRARRSGPMPRNAELVCARPGIEIAVCGRQQEEHGFAGGDGQTSVW
jgi:hypothetical protein